MNSNNATKDLLTAHYQTYPESQIEDIFKFLYQSAFGCEHLLADQSAAIAYIRKEAANCLLHCGEMVEPLDGAYCRVHLDYLKNGLRPETFGKLFVLSAVHEEEGRERLEEKLSAMLELVEEGGLPYAEADVKDALESWRESGFLPCHHSEKFRAAYRPAYRLLKKEYAQFLPLFAQIDSKLGQGRVRVAIDGGSASGKTTLGKLLEKIYGCTVLHMDDFFLRKEQRTAQRLAEPGGNVDRERFLEEVLGPLQEGKVIEYRRFDCGTFALQPAVTIIPTELCVIEGAYSMHPELAKYYDLTVFLDVAPALQEQRIRKRNSAGMAERFFHEWIPLEQKYFEGMQVKERCDIVVSVQE